MKLRMILTLTVLLLGAASLGAQQELADNPDYQAAIQYQKMSDDAYAAGDYDNAYTYSVQAAEYAQKAMDAVEWERIKKEAEDLIKSLNDRFAKLDAQRAEKDYPGQYETATSKHTSAKSAYSAEDYRTSLSEAKAARDALDELDKLLASTATTTDTTVAVDTTTTTTDDGTKDLVLPKYYVVRLIVLRRDCFWRIAAYSFIYNDPTKWRLLYEKNKHLLHQPNNPNLIHPKMVFEIPSLNGETREGTYDPEKKYPVMPKKK